VSTQNGWACPPEDLCYEFLKHVKHSTGIRIETLKSRVQVPMSLPRALSCRATPVRSVFSHDQIRTRVPSRPVGLLFYPALFLSFQQVLRHSLLLALLVTERYHLHYSKNSVFHHLCNSSVQGISPLCRSVRTFLCQRLGHVCTAVVGI
jgi:hypothetical protein